LQHITSPQQPTAEALLDRVSGIARSGLLRLEKKELVGEIKPLSEGCARCYGVSNSIDTDPQSRALRLDQCGVERFASAEGCRATHDAVRPDNASSLYLAPVARRTTMEMKPVSGK